MRERHQDVAVACYVAGRMFGQKVREPIPVLVVGTLVHEQEPYIDEDGRHVDGWCDHFHSMNVYSEHDKQMHPLHIPDDACFNACAQAAINNLRYYGELPDDDHDFALQYG